MAKLRTKLLWCAVCCSKSEFLYEEDLQVWICTLCDALYGDER